MIVDPDFFEHWRTRMLIDALGKDQMAPMYVLRIWAHCQQRRASSFVMNSAGLKALCRFDGDGSLLETALIDAGFVERDGGSVVVPKWLEHNAKLVANWKNGASGGRPKATQDQAGETEEEPKKNPKETHGNPNETHAEPIREDKRREEEKSSTSGAEAPDDESKASDDKERRHKRRPSDEDFDVARWLFDCQQKANPTTRLPNWDAWANDVRLMRERDGRSHREMCGLFKWAKADAFWSPNIQSPAKLREKWDALTERRLKSLPVNEPIKKDWI